MPSCWTAGLVGPFTEMVKASDKQRMVWDAFSNHIRKHNGWVVSERDKSPMRFECTASSKLPDILEDLGYQLRSCGTSQRVGVPVIEEVREHGSKKTKQVTHTGLAMVSIYEFDLPQ